MPRFPSTILPQTNEPAEIQKGILDLLDKINRIAFPMTFPSTYRGTFIGNITGNVTGNVIGNVTGSASGNAPMPQSGPGVGQWQSISSGSGSALVLPSGGTWAYGHGLWYATGTGVVQILGGGLSGGVAAGGTTIMGGAGGYIAFDFAYEVMGPGDFDDSQPVYLRPDGYRITRAGLPFHVLNPDSDSAKSLTKGTAKADQFYKEVTELFGDVDKLVKNRPEKLLPEPLVSAIPQEQQIKMQLLALDSITGPRVLENQPGFKDDEYKDSRGNVQPRTAIQQKQELRARLAVLRGNS